MGDDKFFKNISLENKFSSINAKIENLEILKINWNIFIKDSFEIGLTRPEPPTRLVSAALFSKTAADAITLLNLEKERKDLLQTTLTPIRQRIKNQSTIYEMCGGKDFFNKLPIRMLADTEQINYKIPKKLPKPHKGYAASRGLRKNDSPFLLINIERDIDVEHDINSKADGYWIKKATGCFHQLEHYLGALDRWEFISDQHHFLHQYQGHLGEIMYKRSDPLIAAFRQLLTEGSCSVIPNKPEQGSFRLYVQE